MKTVLFMGKHVALLLMVLTLAFIGVGCDTTSSSSSSSTSSSTSSSSGAGPVSGSVCTENGGFVSGTLDTELKFPCNISQPTGATTLCGGYTNTLMNVRWLANNLAREGFVVLSFTPTNIMGMVSGWRTAHKNCISRLQAINTSHAKLRGMIDKLGISGYSKGGGGALWASADLRTTVATTVAMAPYQEGFTSLSLSSITAATLVQAGTGDTLAPSYMTRGEFNGVGSSNKCYLTYPGSHLVWTTGTAAGAADHVKWIKYHMYGIGSSPCNGSGSSSGCN